MKATPQIGFARRSNAVTPSDERSFGFTVVANRALRPPVSQSTSNSLISLLSPWHIAANLWRRRDLAWQFAQREIELRHRGSKLGAFWALVNPLSMMALYWFLFGVIFQTRFGVLPNESRFDCALAMFFGLTLFHLFSDTFAWAPLVIVSNPNFVKKVVFPLEILPVAKIGDAIYHLVVSLGLVLLGSIFGSAGLSLSVLWLPVIVLPLLLIALGLAWALSSLGVFLRDITQVTAFVSTAVLFASAVMFPPGRIEAMSPTAWRILKFNPLLQIVDLARDTVLWHLPMPWVRLGYVYAVGLIAVVLGHACFMRLRRSFAEVI
jgi:lipopolysaccharide transport system permease protein